ncbi:fatty-acyl-CoA synthase [Streptomyces griseochromogenes]|uniref:Fatty acid--CoA ligase n=1 Tax=Streptomyces griseochromogenes TaxID=68214 RepID=A0A1B1B0R3_9ACTN|nr:AMP-binding protein [Streptomyces griseochromogenes]ANP52426.1 fatty acid--CoA ligase [Streptomyces griseochromogenes]MBP2055344.1 fatty-acyl-CoA synthase [Streptomyces griseochromogenes]
MSQRHAAVEAGSGGYVEAVLHALSAEPSRAVITTAEGLVISAAEFRDRVYRLGGELTERGVSRGATVTLLTGNTAEALVARYAANLAGARVVTLYEGMSPPTMAHVMASVDCTLLLVDDQRLATAGELLQDPVVPQVLSLGPSGFAEDVLVTAAGRPARPMGGLVGPDDDWCIRHTGGTTGIPKGIRMTHGSYRRSLDHRTTNAGDPPRYLACTSLAHLAGIFTDMALHQGGSVVLRHGFEPGDVLATIERERITHIWLLPPLLYQLLDHPDLPRTDLSSLCRITYGGTAASPTRMRQAAKVLGPVLYGLYGQAEAQHITEAGPGEQEVTGRGGQLTVGRALPGVEIAIRDADGTTLPPGERGEVQVRTPYAMHGYWKQPELTAEVLRDGWVHTGDVGYLDEDGYLYIVDRIKEMIVVVGGHVYPAELEDLLLSHPAVAQCAVFGTRDEESVEHVHAAVVPVAGQRPSLEEIRDFVTARKGHLYAPDAVHLMPAIPLTAAGKPDKRMLRSQLSD